MRPNMSVTVLLRLILRQADQLHFVRTLEHEESTFRIIRGRVTGDESSLDVEVSGSKRAVREIEEGCRKLGIRVLPAF